MGKIVAIMATLDEVQYIKDLIEERGKGVLIIDTGLRGAPMGVEADIPRQQLAEASGSTVEKLAAMGRGDAIEIMIRGITKIVKELYAEGRFHGIMAVGGLDGALLAAGAMRALPLGVPKLLLTPVAQGKQTFGAFVGTSDMIVMHSVIERLLGR
jgi:uncharacterized protein (UPF0261 family)